MNHSPLPALAVVVRASAFTALGTACLVACGPAPDAKVGRAAPADEARLVRITGGNPFLDLPGCGPNAFFGSNFEGAEVEPMVAVSPANPDDLVATWFQDASLTYVTAVSRDGGRNWRTVPVPGISACDGGTAQAGADSWLSIGPDETVYLSGFSVHLDALPVPLPTRTTMQVSRGTFAPGNDIAWSAPSVVQAGAGVFHDRPVVTAHPTEPGRAYVLWNDGTQVPPAIVQPLMFSTSDDGGVTWSAPALVHLPPAGISHEGRIHALGDGALLATFMVIATHPFTHQLLSKRSEDGGRTWQAVPTTIAEIPAGPAVPVHGDCRTLAAPIRDEDHGPRCVQMPEQELFADVAPDGSVFATWAQRVADDQSAVRVSRSFDGGRTWLPSVSVSPAAGEKAIPALAIASDGTLGVAWYDFRSDVAGDGLFSSEVWFAHSRDNGATWHEERLAGPFDMNTAPYRLIPVEGLFLGDYFGLVPVDGGFGAVFALPAPYAVAGTTDLFFAKVRVGPGRSQ